MFILTLTSKFWMVQVLESRCATMGSKRKRGCCTLPAMDTFLKAVPTIFRSTHSNDIPNVITFPLIAFLTSKAPMWYVLMFSNCSNFTGPFFKLIVMGSFFCSNDTSPSLILSSLDAIHLFILSMRLSDTSNKSNRSAECPEVLPALPSSKDAMGHCFDTLVLLNNSALPAPVPSINTRRMMNCWNCIIENDLTPPTHPTGQQSVLRCCLHCLHRKMRWATAL